MGLLPPRAPERAHALSSELGISVTAAAVLLRRGHSERAAVERFFDPKLSHLSSPTAMKDRPEAAARIAEAIRARERVCIFGDYDADGITSAAIMTDVLRRLGADVVTLLADRFEGGYGLTEPALGRVLGTGATLLVTCDCGSSDHERLAEARRRGVDAVVIDHHRVPDEALPALAFLNPHRKDCGFAYKGLASCGLCLSLCAAVRAELKHSIDLRAWLDFVALGTIADVAPLDGDNRALVRVGLSVLAQTSRPGVRALAEVVGYNGSVPLTGQDVAFRFAPRINAPGRLHRPDVALQLLLASKPPEARALAGEVDRLCEQRKLLDRALLAEAIELLKDPALAALPVIVLGKQGWHQGVVGIVAGRLAARFGKPTIVIGFDGAAGRGSVRGPLGFPLYEALGRVADVLIGFGGHQAAAGVHVEARKLDQLRDRFAEACADIAAVDARAPALRPQADAVLEELEMPDRVLCDLERFEPCGHGNPAPVLAIEGARLRSAHAVRGGHLRLEVETAAGAMRCFGFEMGALAQGLGPTVRLIGTLRRDGYAGRGAELRLEAVEAVGAV